MEWITFVQCDNIGAAEVKVAILWNQTYFQLI